MKAYEANCAYCRATVSGYSSREAERALDAHEALCGAGIGTREAYDEPKEED